MKFELFGVRNIGTRHEGSVQVKAAELCLVLYESELLISGVIYKNILVYETILPSWIVVIKLTCFQCAVALYVLVPIC